MTVLWSGLALGALYALIAVLFNIGIAQSGAFNFAAPQSVMVGAFVAYELVGQRSFAVPLALLVAALIGAVLGLLVEVCAIRPLKAGSHGALVTTVGAAFLLEGLALVWWGTDTRSVSVPALESVFTIFGGRIAVIDIVLMASAVVIVAALHLASTRTRWGLVGRAATADPEIAMLRGINVPWARSLAFVLAGALGAAIGLLAAVKIHASYDLGMVLLVFAFAALTLGGMGSYWGCLLGGLLIGLVQAYVARYLGSTYGLSMVFVVLLTCLLVRPTGLLGNRALRLV